MNSILQRPVAAYHKSGGYGQSKRSKFVLREYLFARTYRFRPQSIYNMDELGLSVSVSTDAFYIGIIYHYAAFLLHTSPHYPMFIILIILVYYTNTTVSSI